MGLIRVAILPNFVRVNVGGKMDNEFTPEKVSLTKRELDVLRLLAKGYTSTQIAKELGIASRMNGPFPRALTKRPLLASVGGQAHHGGQDHEGNRLRNGCGRANGSLVPQASIRQVGRSFCRSVHIRDAEIGAG